MIPATDVAVPARIRCQVVRIKEIVVRVAVSTNWTAVILQLPRAVTAVFAALRIIL